MEAFLGYGLLAGIWAVLIAWMWKHAKRNDRQWYVWAFLFVFTGPIGMLIYWLMLDDYVRDIKS